ncbi:UNC93-like protein [Pseudozyma hubeiensis SY62]|uniref:UNC93-like protein n=1 Tax=Pseudozyma hubeiensis (strain SY62) TaxID=1305764 RepID=R9P983_PSEHS|nr:UNC93-like protein [Pseudozyma hubeiensis SY62]GAC97899.1 UNC93-like protein [Pseudozyma hubeiensis SY62]
MDNDKHPFMTNLAVTWGLCAAGLIFVIPVIALRVKEHTDALQEVTVPGRAEEIAAVEQEVANASVSEKHT